MVENWIDVANQFALHIFLDTDCPFVQDGTRLSEQERNALSGFHLQQLKDAGAEYVVVGGNWEERFEQAKTVINKRFFNH
jgi:HTH-type transcriptional repressor of NAD biosynthesis genes